MTPPAVLKQNSAGFRNTFGNPAIFAGIQHNRVGAQRIEPAFAVRHEEAGGAPRLDAVLLSRVKGTGGGYHGVDAQDGNERDGNIAS